MLRSFIIVFACSFVVAAAAQQPPQTAVEQALSQKLNEELNEEIQLRTSLIAERLKSAELQKQLDDLKPKTESPK